MRGASRKVPRLLARSGVLNVTFLVCLSVMFMPHSSRVQLREALRVPEAVAEIEASAKQGWGVFDTLKRITKDCLKLVGDPTVMEEGRSPSILPGKRPSMFPDAAPPAVTVPRAPRVPAMQADDSE